jgi:topoisomerase-4 subunit B
VASFRDGRTKVAEFCKGKITENENEKSSSEKNGTLISFVPDDSVFYNFRFNPDHVRNMLLNYVYLNKGLVINYNGENFIQRTA